MRVLIFHGYLLRGTGSNVYNAELASTLARMGHEVHLLCQDREPLELEAVDAVGEWRQGVLRLERRRDPARLTVYRPEIGGLLPVYVADRYGGIEARPFPELSDAELEAYLDSNVAAVREVARRVRPDVALANHLVMGPAILARALGAMGTPYAVKIHGSALEYTVKPHRRFVPFAEEGLAGAAGVLVGSRHTAESLWAAIPQPGLREKTWLGPPGVDVHAFAPRERVPATTGLRVLAERLSAEAADATEAPPGSQESSFARDAAAAGTALSALHPEADRLVVFVGKLIVSKGIDLLLAAWPLVLAAVPDARLVVVGFGAYRDACERLAAALAQDDRETVETLARAGRAEEDGPAGQLSYLLAFLGTLDADPEARARYTEAAAALPERVVFTGRLEHHELVDLLPTCEAMVVPSTFPEAFGMVAAEAAACGALPVSAHHSGLAEVSDALAETVPDEAREWLSFELGPHAVPAIAERLVAWLEAPEELRAATRRALVAATRERWSWEGVARTVIDAAQGRPGTSPRRATG